jgi:putative (di)nucleoside polyphosphate hydrolase
MSATEDDSAYRPGVGIMLLSPAHRVFVARRIDLAEEAWQMPQGGIDPGEAPQAAAMRELKEEIGTDKAEIIAESREWLRYDLPQAFAAKVWRGRFRGQRQKWFAMRFTGSNADIDLATEHPEFNAWKWADPRALPDLIIPFKRQLYVDVLREFAAILGS